MNEKKCKYCGAKLKKPEEQMGYCYNCKRKRLLVRELVGICQQIKMECGR